MISDLHVELARHMQPIRPATILRGLASDAYRENKEDIFTYQYQVVSEMF